MVKGKTSTGFEYEVDAAHMKNMEFLELFAEMQGGDGLATFKVIRTVLGEDQKKKLYDHCRDEKGMVPVDAITAEISEIFEALASGEESKN